MQSAPHRFRDAHAVPLFARAAHNLGYAQARLPPKLGSDGVPGTRATIFAPLAVWSGPAKLPRWYQTRKAHFADLSSQAIGGRFNNDSIESHHFVVRKAAECFLICFQDFFTAFCVRPHPQAIRESLRDHGAQIDASSARNALRVPQGIRGKGKGRSPL